MMIIFFTQLICRVDVTVVPAHGRLLLDRSIGHCMVDKQVSSQNRACAVVYTLFGHFEVC